MKTLLYAYVASIMIYLPMMAETPDAKQFYDIVPLPRQIQAVNGTPFVIDAATVIAYDQDAPQLGNNACFLAEYIHKQFGIRPEVHEGISGRENTIILKSGSSDCDEGYNIKVTPDSVVIAGRSPAGCFYGIQTLRKSLASQNQRALPPVEISDSPRFGYRGAHLDVARHFFTVDEVKGFIDILALHNVNKFHWHLTDDQGWRLPLRKYPELTEKGSVRPGTCIGKDFDSNDGIEYGGCYTREEVEDIIRHAADRYIEVIPEIDLPGHMLAALKAYPELGCTGGPYELWTRWGVADEVLCAGNDKTLDFIDSVLEEVCDLFPSSYVHVGGDECPKVRWKECPKCQAKIKELGLDVKEPGKAEEKLQSYIMRHAAQTLKGKGKKMIGWDEILEGGAPEDAVIMSWRGEAGGVAAASSGHHVVMVPVDYCYLDYYQSLDAEEPLAIGGFVSLEKVYSYEPLAPKLPASDADRIIGTQANLWTEYITTMKHAQYMELPRLAAMSEVQWCGKDGKDYDAFLKRLPGLIRIYDAEGYNYSDHFLDIRANLSPDRDEKKLTLSLSTSDDSEIRFTLDGSEVLPTSQLYSNPLCLDTSTTVKGAVFRNGVKGREYCDSVTFSKSTFANVKLPRVPHPKYTYEGARVLTDGIYGKMSFSSGEWLGFEGGTVYVNVDLKIPQEISSVEIGNFISTPDWIFDAREISVEASLDGMEYHQIASIALPRFVADRRGIERHKLSFPEIKARYVRLREECENVIPDFHDGKGKPAFVFIDEISIH